MSFDGALMHFLKIELKDILIGSRLEKITFDGSNFYFQFYLKGERNFLKFDLTGGKSSCYITTKLDKANAEHPFLFSLRKNLNGNTLEDISQISTDRTFEFHFKEYNIVSGIVMKRLIFEATGRHHNLYIVDDNDIIIDCYRKIFSDNNRTLIPKAKFNHLNSGKKALNEYTYHNNINDITEKYDGVSRILATYLIENPLINPLDILVNPCLYNNKKAYFFHVDDKNTPTFYHTISEAFDNIVKKTHSVKIQYITLVNKQIAKANKKIHNFNTQLIKAKDNLVYSEYGNYIYSSGKDLSVKVDKLDHITLDPLLTINQNAQKYFKLYQKARRTLTSVEEQIKFTNELLETYHVLLDEIEHTDEADIEQIIPILTDLGIYQQKRFKKSRNRMQSKKVNITKINLGNDIVYIGKNHVQNAYLINHIAKHDDYWFHVKNASGSHVLLRTNKLSEENIRITSMIAAYYSSLKQSSSIPVDYVLVKFLKKIPKLPSYRLNYSNEKTIFIDINEDLINRVVNTH